MNIEEINSAPDDAMFQIGDTPMSKADVLAHLKKTQLDVQASIVRQRDEWVRHRSQSGVEERWRRAQGLYMGEDVPDSSFVELLKNGPSAKKKQGDEPIRSRVVVNIVRPKVDQAVARMCEILLPVDDRNFSIKPTPVPSTVQKMIGDETITTGADGQPTGVTADAEAQSVVKATKDAAEAMLEAIDDNLTECHYNAQQRAGINDGVRLGTMVILGPFPAKQQTKAWGQGEGGEHALSITESIVPATKRADPWDVWFDPACGNDHQRGAGFWHRTLATKKELRRLAGLPGYDAEALREVLLVKPTRIRMAEGRVSRMAAQEEAYELWTYHGDIEPDDMAAASMNTGDPLEDVEFGVVMLVNDKVIGAMPSWIVDKSLPCDVWNWREADDSPYGYGLPHELEHQQRVVTSAWRQVMDNATASVGSQIVYMKGVQPANGSYQITPNKLWVVDPDKIDDIKKAFEVFDFPSHLQDLLAIAKAAMEFADTETSMPQLMSGEKGSAPETVGGMVMLYNNANTVLRMRVKLYDDKITSPHIGRYYDWNMENNPDPKVKGDMQVDARGSTALLEKDIQNQATLNLSSVTSNPRYAAYLDVKEELKMVLKAFKIQPDMIMASEDQIKKNLQQPAPPDPRIQAAEMTLEAKKLDIADRKEDRQVELQRDASSRQEGALDREYNQQREQGEYVIAMTNEQNTRDLQEQRIAADKMITAAELETETGIKHLEIDTKRQLFNAEVAVKAAQGSGI